MCDPDFVDGSVLSLWLVAAPVGSIIPNDAKEVAKTFTCTYNLCLSPNKFPHVEEVDLASFAAYTESADMVFLFKGQWKRLVCLTKSTSSISPLFGHTLDEYLSFESLQASTAVASTVPVSTPSASTALVLSAPVSNVSAVRNNTWAQADALGILKGAQIGLNDSGASSGPSVKTMKRPYNQLKVQYGNLGELKDNEVPQAFHQWLKLKNLDDYVTFDLNGKATYYMKKNGKTTKCPTRFLCAEYLKSALGHDFVDDMKKQPGQYFPTPKRLSKAVAAVAVSGFS